MNEHQVENLLSSHGDEILRRRRIGDLAAKPRNQWRRPLLFAGVTAAIAMAFVVALPRNADAARIQKIGKALKGVKSMEYWGYARSNGREWRLMIHSINQDGLIRQEVAKSRALRVTFVINNGVCLTNYDRLPFATMSKQGASEEEGEQITDPLKIAITNLAGSPDADQYSVNVNESAPSNGRPTYMLAYKAKRRGANLDSREFEILVDAETNLPIESNYRSVDKGVHAESKFQYAYNKRYNESLFSLEPNKAIIYPDQEQKKLVDQWSKVKSSDSIYAATVSPEGTIWIAFGVSDWQNMGSVPSAVEVPDGTRYVKGFDRITSWQHVNKTFRIRGREVIVTPFIPLSDPTSLPTSVRIGYGIRNPDDRSIQQLEERFTTMNLVSEKWNIPSYFPAISYDRDMLGFPTEFWRRRAEKRQELGDIKGAAEAFEMQAEKCKGFVEYIGYKPLLEAAKCYDILGNPDKAKALRTKAEELQRTRIR